MEELSKMEWYEQKRYTERALNERVTRESVKTPTGGVHVGDLNAVNINEALLTRWNNYSNYK
jgi:hypothetical protein